MNTLKNLASALAIPVLLCAAGCQLGDEPNAQELGAAAPLLMQTPIPTAPTPPGNKTILLGLLLDTSSSMDGLIDQAKAQLWNIVNKLSEARCDGQRPTVKVALYEYGNSGLAVRSNYIRQVSPFTTKMDDISKELFALRTNGGEEYCGAVLSSALDQLDWGTNEGDLRIVYVCGNEPFTQGPISFATSCERARAKGILVNTIFCGDHQEGINTSWQAGALAAKGDYFSINQDAVTTQVRTPFDDELAQLNIGLNGYAVHYGSEGMYQLQNNEMQDKNAESLGWSSFGSRAKYKAYNGAMNKDWDLTELEGGSLDSVIVRLDKKTLPEKYRGLAESDLKAVVTQQREQKETTRARIADLVRQREAFIAQHNAQAGITNELENAVLRSIEKAAGGKGFQFVEPKADVPPVPTEKVAPLKAPGTDKKAG
jgi:von Willebrand factor type A domain